MSNRWDVGVGIEYLDRFVGGRLRDSSISLSVEDPILTDKRVFYTLVERRRGNKRKVVKKNLSWSIALVAKVLTNINK